MKKDGYTWWTKRIKAMSELYDVVRIDHFRGFDSYYAIPARIRQQEMESGEKVLVWTCSMLWKRNLAD